MRVAMLFAALSSVAMILGLARWPSIHWELAQAYAGLEGLGDAFTRMPATADALGPWVDEIARGLAS